MKGLELVLCGIHPFIMNRSHAMQASRVEGSFALGLTALAIAGAWACSSQNAIAISLPGDAAASETGPGVTSTTTTTGATTSTTTSTSTSTTTATISTTSTTTSTSTALFHDDFGGGYEVNWLLSTSNDGPVSDTTDGTNRIVTLDSSSNDYSRLRCNLDGAIFTNTDIIASMKVRVERAPSSDRTVRLDVRQATSTENIFYAVGATVTTDGSITRVGIYKKVDDGSGGYTICALAQGHDFATPVAMNQWRTIKLTIAGTTSVHLAAFFEDAQMASYVDDCVSPLTSTAGNTVPNGGCLAQQTGLGIQIEKGIIASVDDVLVTAP